MNATDQRLGQQRLASSISIVFKPPLVLVIIVALAGIEAGLGWAGVIMLLLGIAIVPALIYKKSKKLFQRWGLSDHWRTNFVVSLTFVGALTCYLLDLGEPVPQTVAALFVGNAGITLSRRWLNVSAHVSVITFAVLWVIAIYGGAWSWLLILSPLMLFSRVAIREHSWSEALAGASLGLVTFCCFHVAMTWS